jgi:hypothetical protein
MDVNLQEIVSRCSTVDQSLTEQANTISLQKALIEQLKAQAAEGSQTPLILSNLEKSTSWIQAGTTGNKGGGDPNAPKQGIFTPGYPATFAMTGKNPYWYIQLAKINAEILNRTRFTYALAFQFPDADQLKNCQAVEFELQAHIGAEIYNMAWQMPLKEKFMWRTFDFTNKAWEQTPQPMPVDTSLIQPGRYLYLLAEYYRDPNAKTLTHVALSINGRKNLVGVTRPCTTAAVASSFNAAFQLDSATGLAPYHVLAENFEVVAT